MCWFFRKWVRRGAPPDREDRDGEADIAPPRRAAPQPDDRDGEADTVMRPPSDRPAEEPRRDATRAPARPRAVTPPAPEPVPTYIPPAEPVIESDPVIELPPATEPPAAVKAYDSSDDNLTDELRRVEQLVRAHLFHLKAAPADAAQAVLRAPFRWRDTVDDPDCASARCKALDAAARWERHIVARLRLTPATRSTATGPAGRDGLRAWELARLFALVPHLEQIVPPPGRKAPDAVRTTLLLDVVLLMLLLDRAPRYRAALGAVTPETVLEVLQPDVPPGQHRRSAFAPAGVLRARGLIHLGPGDDPAVRCDPRVADYLLCADRDDPGLGDAVRVVAGPYDVCELGVDPAVRQRIADLAAWLPEWFKQTPASRRFVALFHGPYGSPTLAAARVVWGGRRLTVVDVPRAPTGADWLPFVQRVYNEAHLKQRAVFWQGTELLLAETSGTRWDDLIAAAECFEWPTFLSGETAWDPARAFHKPNHIFVRVEFPVPGADTRRCVWIRRLAAEKSVLADDAPAHAAALDLIASFQFTEGQIDDAVATARGLFRPPTPRPHDPTGALDAEVYYEACRRQSGRRLVSFAQRIQPKPGDNVPEDRKEDELLCRLVLSEAAERHLLELFRRMRHLTTVYHGLGFEHRLSIGRGLIALFTGPTGTGKTYAAATLAGLLQKDLYKVDMAAVVSKYVGETEKNLSRVFADAQDANAVLFFDEADALFGKRGEIEQAQDRWANLEVNYLLQRVEEYTGTVILATNHRHNIDGAFLRRIQVMIEFDRPTAEARLKILEGLFRGTAVAAPDAETVLKPVADQFVELTGGNLKNVVLDAVFRAVATTPPKCAIRIELLHLVLGAAREYQKLGKPVNAATFGKKWAELVGSELKIPVR